MCEDFAAVAKPIVIEIKVESFILKLQDCSGRNQEGSYLLCRFQECAKNARCLASNELSRTRILNSANEFKSNNIVLNGQYFRVLNSLC